MTTVTTTVTGLTTTGTNVVRGRVRPVETHPALSVEQGADEVAPERNQWPLIGRDLNLKIIIHVKDNDDYETQLNTIREEVYAALMADRTLGLSYVIDIVPIGDDESEPTGDADQIVSMQQMNFIIMYDHPQDDAGV